MPRASKRVCAKPGCPAMQAQRLCAEHQAAEDRHQRRTTPTKVTRDWHERQRRKAAVETHRRSYGDWCPGYKRPAHAAADLTADHLTPVGAGGAPSGPLRVLCRSCNSSRGATL